MSVAIVGGGIAGLTTAIALHQAGVAATVYERVTDVAGSQLGAGLGLAYNATRVLRKIGLLDAARTVGASTERFEFRDAKGKLLSHWAVAPGEVQLGVTRKALHRILVDALPAATLVSGKTCTAFTDREGSVEATFDDGTTAEADVLVGADGLRSAIREQIHGKEPPRYAGFSVLRTVVPVESDAPLPAGVFRHFWGRRGSLGMYHVGPGLVYVFQWQLGPEGEHVPRGRRKAEWLARCAGWATEAAALVERAEEDAIHQTDIYDRRPPDFWGRGRATLAGDAAHAMTFNMGQGACQGMEDAAVLARRIATEGATPGALQSYEDDRRVRAIKFTRASSRIAKLSVMTNPLGCKMRNLVLRGAGRRVSRGEEMLKVEL
jgi:2-polyprenyl-6-methoxyphenol hydroxylase-like FAD-dependent oxidoreductase